MIKFFRRYQSLKKIYTQETQGIEHGKCYIFPKIDGTNAQTWFDGEQIMTGSRNRTLGETRETDNAGFCKAMRADKRINDFHKKYPNVRLYGEWLVPHSLKTYRDDAWKKFYIFDVVVENNCEEETNDFRYLSYDEYKPMLDEFQLDYVVPLYIIDCPTKEQLIHAMNNNIFLLADGAGVGEGIVVKNYSFINRYGLVVWAKWITSEFKEQHYKTMGVPEIQNNSIVEKSMIEAGITRTLIAKEYFKIIQAEGTWERKFIPRLLEVVYYCFITEEFWELLKVFKSPNVDFRLLESLCLAKTKELFPEMFKDGVSDFNI